MDQNKRYTPSFYNRIKSKNMIYYNKLIYEVYSNGILRGVFNSYKEAHTLYYILSGDAVIKEWRLR